MKKYAAKYAAADRFTAIEPTLSLVKHAKAEHVAVFFITGRRVPQLEMTRENVSKAGYPDPDGVMLRPVDDRTASVVPFKSGARAAIKARGFTYKLPNPMYFIP